MCVCVSLRRLGSCNWFVRMHFIVHFSCLINRIFWFLRRRRRAAKRASVHRRLTNFRAAAAAPFRSVRLFRQAQPIVERVFFQSTTFHIYCVQSYEFVVCFTRWLFMVECVSIRFWYFWGTVPRRRRPSLSHSFLYTLAVTLLRLFCNLHVIVIHYFYFAIAC